LSVEQNGISEEEEKVLETMTRRVAGSGLSGLFGLSGLSGSKNEINEINQTDQTNQIDRPQC
jgi:hypothetical protein